VDGCIYISSASDDEINHGGGEKTIVVVARGSAGRNVETIYIIHPSVSVFINLLLIYFNLDKKYIPKA